VQFETLIFPILQNVLVPKTCNLKNSAIFGYYCMCDGQFFFVRQPISLHFVVVAKKAHFNTRPNRLLAANGTEERKKVEKSRFAF
jgi:hypothetical protein